MLPDDEQDQVGPSDLLRFIGFVQRDRDELFQTAGRGGIDDDHLLLAGAVAEVGVVEAAEDALERAAGRLVLLVATQ